MESGLRGAAHYLEDVGISTAADVIAYMTHSRRYQAPEGRYGLTTSAELQHADGSWTEATSIGPKLARQLDDWRREALRKAEASMPTSLSAQDE
jgi:hypothetical protein